MKNKHHGRIVINENATYFRSIEAAAYLGVSYATFYRRIKKGLIPPGRKFENSVTWKRSELDAYIDGLPFSDRPCIKRGDKNNG